MTTKKTTNKEKQTLPMNNYDIDENQDYVIVLKPNGVNDFYLPKHVIVEDEEGNTSIDTENVDIRFVTTSFSLKDKETFNKIVENFNEYAAGQGSEEV